MIACSQSLEISWTPLNFVKRHVAGSISDTADPLLKT